MRVFYDERVYPLLQRGFEKEELLLKAISFQTDATVKAVNHLTYLVGEMIQSQERSNMLQESIASTLDKLYNKLLGVPKPGPMSHSLVKEDASMLVVALNLPALPDPLGDIVSQKLAVNISGVGEEIPVTLEQTTVELKGNDNDSCECELSYIDDAGNEGPAQVYNFIFTDTLPPPQPAAMTHTVLREE